MKSALHLAGIALLTPVLLLCVLLSSAVPLHASCVLDEDWPNRPCLDAPPYSEDYIKGVWQGYYDLKGKDWMQARKLEMHQAIREGNLKEWVQTGSSQNNFSNHNVWFYYYLNGDAPDAYGPLPTPVLLLECEAVGIEIGRCSEEAILGRHCLGGGCDDASGAVGTFDASHAVLFAIASAGIIAGILVGTRLGKV